MDLQIFETLVSESIRPPSVRVERLPQKFEAHGFDGHHDLARYAIGTPDGLYREVITPRTAHGCDSREGRQNPLISTQKNGWLLQSLLLSRLSHNHLSLP